MDPEVTVPFYNITKYVNHYRFKRMTLYHSHMQRYMIKSFELRHEITNNEICVTSKASWVCTCQNATLLEITCSGSFLLWF